MKFWRFAFFLFGACAPVNSQDVAEMRAAFTPARMARLNAPLLLASTEDGRLAATLIQVGKNGEVTTWQSRDGVQLSMRDGVIVATRGLGKDIHASATPQRQLGIRVGRGSYIWQISRLDGNFALKNETYRCTVRQIGSQVFEGLSGDLPINRHQESCTGQGSTFTNRYDVGRDGFIWASRQWIGPDFGYLTLEVIKR